MEFVYLFFIVASVYIAMAVQTLSKDKNDSLNRVFYIISMLFFVWSIINGVMYLITDINIAVEVRKYSVFAWGLIYSLILHFSLINTGITKKINSIWLYVCLYLPAGINIFLYFFMPVNANELLLTERGWVLAEYFTRGIFWDNYFYVYYVSFMLLTLIVLYYGAFRGNNKRVELQSKVMFYTFTIAFVAGSIFEIVLPINGIFIFYGVTVVIALIPIGGIRYAMTKYGLMNFSPEQLALEVLQLMDEGLIICDIRGDVKRINEGAKKLLDYDELTSNSIFKYFEHLDLTKTFNSKELKLTRPSRGVIDILVSLLPLYDSVGEQYGSLLIFQDISDLKNIQKKLFDANVNLENIVQERTMDLIDANEELLKEIKEKEAANNLNSYMATHDYLTDLPNKRYVSKKLEKMTQEKIPFALLFLDLDSFKEINDVLGHVIGDRLLKIVSEKLKDIQPDLYEIARYGGDEFIIIVKDYKDIEGLNKILDQIFKIFEKTIALDNHDVHVSISVGVSLYPQHSFISTELIKYADIAMYVAKLNGQNRYEIFNNSMKESLDDEFNLTADLYKAVEEKTFVLHYQPQIDTRTNKIVGMEALIRWNHPNRGLLYPDAFIQLSEKNGLIILMGELVINEAMRQYSIWSDNYDIEFPISVNISPIQLVSDRFDRFIDQLVNDYGSLSMLEFEVTETIFLSDWDKVILVLRKLNAAGCKIVIDDFGVEYSSFSYIKKMPLSKIKIDKSFISEVLSNQEDIAIVKSIINISENLEMKVVAEGVETSEQVDFLKENHCFIIQGYYFSRPKPANEIEKIFEKYNLIYKKKFHIR